MNQKEGKFLYVVISYVPKEWTNTAKDLAIFPLPEVIVNMHGAFHSYELAQKQLTITKAQFLNSFTMPVEIMD